MSLHIMHLRWLIVCCLCLSPLLSVRIHRRVSSRRNPIASNATTESASASLKLFRTFGLLANWMNGAFYPIGKDADEDDLSDDYNEYYSLTGSHQGLSRGSGTKIVFNLVTPHGRLELESKPSDKSEAYVLTRPNTGDWISLELHPKHWVPHKTADLTYVVEDKRGLLEFTWNGDQESDRTVKEVRLDPGFTGHSSSAEKLLTQIKVGDQLTAVSTKLRLNPSRHIMSCLPDIRIPLMTMEDRTSTMKQRLLDTKGLHRTLEFVRGGGLTPLPMAWSLRRESIEPILQRTFQMPQCCGSFHVQVHKETAEKFKKEAEASLDQEDAAHKVQGDQYIEGNFSYIGMVAFIIKEKVVDGEANTGNISMAFRGTLAKNEMHIPAKEIPDSVRRQLLARR